MRLLGLDIGGTRSRARVCVDGEIVAEAEAASASLTAAGTASAAAALADLLARLPADPGPPFDAVCAGSAGAEVPGARAFLHDHLAPLTRSGTVVIVNDAMLVLPAAGLDDGIAVICGTGSIAIGSCPGRGARAGGWGYLLGDEGSGYWIARAAIRTLLDRRDRGVPPGELGGRLTAAAGVPDTDALHKLFYDQPHPRHWAGYAPLILDSADPAAADITAEAARALAVLAASAAQRLAAPAGLPVVLAGGLMRHRVLEAATRRAIGEALPGSDIRTLTQPPVAGAVRLAGAAVRSGGRPARNGPGQAGRLRPFVQGLAKFLQGWPVGQPEKDMTHGHCYRHRPFDDLCRRQDAQAGIEGKVLYRRGFQPGSVTGDQDLVPAMRGENRQFQCRHLRSPSFRRPRRLPCR
jgi:glucosamine kinase